MVTVVATKEFTHKGRTYQRGAPVEMAAIEAAVLARTGEVSLLERPTYQTRDMQAAPVKAVAPEPIPSQPIVKRRRGRPRKIKA